MRSYRAYINTSYPKPYSCIRLVLRVWREMFDRDLPEDDIVEHTMDALRAYVVPVDSPLEGDIILLKGEEWHIGLVTRPGFMLHTSPEGLAVLERYDGLAWKSRIKGFYRWHE